ncbi:AraC family transcriptional regulator [Candidatus Galacturonibacter soehngenii]|uniref:Helix-turn-helix transcriptional regulator n=1 Tax=Candidatus Galacturonatibacter soehngenii TaxID=2307010 RepID=A0A7V7UGY3_9FIRM|nr:AraC family transcriptional regulator [Candidatus Galacturonibacter soehngenii]KAB1439438.1 helix-turn-helix transcriptional regulator [Candidatus Galacturonibacter soehngenii]MBA4687302.1 helix-turn-helix transcriptional regulator [Candidatus Galacturonibacter soehngenii]
MNTELMDRLKPVTEEEKRILIGDKKINKEIYTTSNEFTIDSNKMLEKGRLIDIRTHTRFIDFPAHKHNYIEIMYMCTGKTTHIINGDTKVVLEKGNLLFLNQFSYHEILPAGMEDIGINFIILPEFFDEVLPMLHKDNALSNFLVDTLRQNTTQASYLHYKVCDIIPIQNLIENLVWDLINKQHNHRQIDQTTMGLLFMQLVNQTERIEYDKQNQSYNTVAIKVLKYIEENYKTANLTTLAKSMNQSISSLSKMIKSSTGSTFKELLQNKRLNQSAHLLSATKLPITDIIYMVGYDNTSYFHRIFKERYGLSPKQYRDKKESNDKTM